MGIKRETTRLLKRLAGEVIKEPVQVDSPYGKWGAIPSALLPSEAAVDEDSATTENLGISLTLDETTLYRKCVYALVREPELEHLLSVHKIEREIDQQLWELVCELSLNRKQYKDAGKRNERLKRFVADVAKPLEEYEVLFAIDHLKMDEDEFAIGAVTFFHLNAERASKWGISTDRSGVHLIGKAVARVCVRAGSFKKAAERAKERIDAALSVLRVSGARMRFTYDNQLQQRRGQDYAAKNLSNTDRNVGWELGSVPLDLELRGQILAQFSENLARLQPIIDGAVAGDLGERLARALEWVSSSMTRERVDDRVVDLCTAMETLLTTKNDKLKGEALSLRVLLLAKAGERGTLLLHPLEVLNLYELRSDIIHGSARNVCGKRHYQLLRHVVLDAIQDVISLGTSNQKINSVSKLIAELQQEARVQEAIAWVKETSVPDTRELKSLLSCVERWNKPKK